MGAHPQPQLCLTNAPSPAQRFIFLLEGPGQTSGDQHRPEQMLRHYRQLAGHLSISHLLTCPWCCDSDWQAFGQLSNMAYSRNLTRRKEKKKICHRYYLGFFGFRFVFLGGEFLFVCFVLFVVADYFCGYPTPQIQGQSPQFCLVICGITS